MFFDREALETREAQWLAPYATLSKNSVGRQYLEEEPRYRTSFQRDRDRVLHSAAFRRLEYKTQVFVNDEGDYNRTRLTHTLEVAQIGRTIARTLGVNEDLVEAICLAHDLGHPPFGHAGERALDRLMKDEGGFNHNFQSYRVVTELEQRYPNWNGLNLTQETLDGIAKHETTIDVSAAIGLTSELGPSLEAQIADFSDSLAYNAHDLDDGLNAGLITSVDLKQLAIWRFICERRGWDSDAIDDIKRHILVREIVGICVDDAVSVTADELQKLNPQDSHAIQRYPARIVRYSHTVTEYSRELKAFLYEKMYRHYRVIRMQTRAERFITELFEAFNSDPRQLPPAYQDEVRQKGQMRTIADYIASMTDRSALLEYRRLFDPEMRP